MKNKLGKTDEWVCRAVTGSTLVSEDAGVFVDPAQVEAGALVFLASKCEGRLARLAKTAEAVLRAQSGSTGAGGGGLATAQEGGEEKSTTEKNLNKVDHMVRALAIVKTCLL